MRVELQPAFILHHRPYRNSSLLLEVLTREYGRIGLIAKGVRTVRGGGQNKRSLLQPFRALLLSYSGKNDLQVLAGVEARRSVFGLSGVALFSGFYINELLMRLLHRHDPHENVFNLYAYTLEGLGGNSSIEPLLRRFEYVLLNELGYGIPLSCDAVSHKMISETGYYHYSNDVGFTARDESVSGREIFSGRCIRAISEQRFDDPDCLGEMKRLMRLVLNHYLGDKPLKSRELFR